MSPLLRDQLHVFLGPDELVIHHVNRRIFGNKVSMSTTPCPEADSNQALWQPAIDQLEKTMGLIGNKCELSVVISNAFVRYQLLDAQAELKSYEEESAYVKFKFNEIYGGISNHWDFTWGPGLQVSPQVVTAIDQALLLKLKALCVAFHARLISVQPSLARLFNALNKQSKSDGLRFIFIEGRHLCAGLLAKGQWVGLRSARFEGVLQDNLSDMIEREFVMTDTSMVNQELVLCLPQKIDIHSSSSRPVLVLVARPAGLLVNAISAGIVRK